MDQQQQEQPSEGRAAQATGRGEVPSAGEIMRVTIANAQVTPEQAQALVALSQGASLAEAAAAGGVDRGTLYRWRKTDRNFISVLNAWRQEQQASAQDALLALTRQAVKAVEMGLGEGDGRLGLRMLDKLGAARIGPTEPTHPRQIFGPEIDQEEADQLWKQLESSIMDVPPERRPGVARIIQYALRIEASWGAYLLEGLAKSQQHEILDADQSIRAGAMIMAQLRQEAAARAADGHGAL